MLFCDGLSNNKQLEGFMCVLTFQADSLHSWEIYTKAPNMHKNQGSQFQFFSPDNLTMVQMLKHNETFLSPKCTLMTKFFGSAEHHLPFWISEQSIESSLIRIRLNIWQIMVRMRVWQKSRRINAKTLNWRTHCLPNMSDKILPSWFLYFHLCLYAKRDIL